MSKKSPILANGIVSLGSSASTISIVGSGTGGSSVGVWGVTDTSVVKPNSINVNGDAVFHGNITWKGRDMREWFESVEARLGLLHPNSELEKEWSELAELRMRYVDLERQLLEKQQVFDILKKT